MQSEADKQMEVSIGRMLRVGVTLSAVVVLLGGVLALVRSGGQRVPDYTRFVAAAPALRSLPAISAGVLHLRAPDVISAGILLLIATPVVRVAFCVAGFARQGDRMYVVVSGLVLAILAYSLVQGGR